MKKYEIDFYFGTYEIKPGLSPSTTVMVEVSDGTLEQDIVLKALSIVGSYPRTYTYSLREINYL